jgi:hypothetical protein
LTTSTVDSPHIIADNSEFPTGTYKLLDLVTGNDAGLLFVYYNGQIYCSPNLSLLPYSSAVLKAELLTGIDTHNGNSHLISIQLYQNYPNPFNPNTTISFDIPIEGNVKLIIFNSNGQEVQTILNKRMGKGSHTLQYAGENLRSGIYFYRLESGGFAQTRKMLLLK